MIRALSFVFAAALVGLVLHFRKPIDSTWSSLNIAASSHDAGTVLTASSPAVPAPVGAPDVSAIVPAPAPYGPVMDGVASIDVATLPTSETPECREPETYWFFGGDGGPNLLMREWIEKHKSPFTCRPVSDVVFGYCCVPFVYRTQAAATPRPRPKRMVWEFDPRDAIIIDAKAYVADSRFTSDKCDRNNDGTYTFYPHGGRLVEKSETRR